MLRSLVTGHPLVSEAAPITGPMYQLFIFFMITDPKTTVRTYRGQCVVAFLVAAVEAGFRLMEWVHAPYYALFVVGPIANLVEIVADRRRRARLRSTVPPRLRGFRLQPEGCGWRSEIRMLPQPSG